MLYRGHIHEHPIFQAGSFGRQIAAPGGGRREARHRDELKGLWHTHPGCSVRETIRRAHWAHARRLSSRWYLIRSSYRV
jgi:hypothetical protein